jgi:hypothetical protein
MLTRLRVMGEDSIDKRAGGHYSHRLVSTIVAYLSRLPLTPIRPSHEVVKIVARSRDQQVFGCLSQFRRVRRWPSEARLSFGYALSRRPPVFGNRSPGARRHARHPGRTRVISRRLPGTARRVWRDRQGATSKGERRGDPFGAPGNAGIQGGTESSNLLCSSGESDANSTAAQRQRIK